MCPGFPDEIYQHTLIFSFLAVGADGGKMLSNIYNFFLNCKILFFFSFLQSTH